MKISAVYIRVSTDNQLEQSPESQLAEIQKFAAKNEYIIPDEFIFAEQEGISGRNADKRPEFQRMIGTANQPDKPFEVILVWKFSRFARNRQDSIVYKRMLRKQLGIEVISVNENIGTENDGVSGLLEAVIEAMDEYYSMNLAEEVKRGMTNKVRNGKAVFCPPFGYKLVNKELVIDEERAEIVKSIYNDFLAGGHFRGIAKTLSNAGILGLKGKSIDVHTIIRILYNPIYIGKIRWSMDGRKHTTRFLTECDENTLIVDGGHTPIVDVETFNKAQERLKSLEYQYPKKAKANGEVNRMLKGLARCGGCGGALVKSQIAYQCCGFMRGICKKSHSVKAEILDGMFIDALEKINVESMTLSAPSAHSKRKTDVTAAQIKRVEDKIRRIKEGYENGIYSMDEAKGRIESEKKELERLKAVSQPEDTGIERKKEIISLCKNGVIDMLKNPDVLLKEKNELLRTFVSKVVYFGSADKRIEILFH